MIDTFAHWFALARTALDRRRAVESLSRLSDAQLHDIGLVRGALDEHVRDGLPWQSYQAASVRPLRSSLQGCG